MACGCGTARSWRSRPLSAPAHRRDELLAQRALHVVHAVMKPLAHVPDVLQADHELRFRRRDDLARVRGRKRRLHRIVSVPQRPQLLRQEHIHRRPVARLCSRRLAAGRLAPTLQKPFLWPLPRSRAGSSGSGRTGTNTPSADIPCVLSPWSPQAEKRCEAKRSAPQGKRPEALERVLHVGVAPRRTVAVLKCTPRSCGCM